MASQPVKQFSENTRFVSGHRFSDAESSSDPAAALGAGRSIAPSPRKRRRAQDDSAFIANDDTTSSRALPLGCLFVLGLRSAVRDSLGRTFEPRCQGFANLE